MTASRLAATCALAASLLGAGLAHANKGGTTPVGGACTSDGDCVDRSICTENTCTALPRGRRIFPLYWHQPGEVGHRHIVPLLYFSTWDRDKLVRVQVPFFAQTKNHATQGTTTIIPWLAFFYTHYKGQGEAVGLMPFVYWKRRGLQRTLALPLLLSGYSRDGARDRTEALIALFAYYRRERDDTWRVWFPLVWDRETAKTRTTVVPPLGFFRRTESTRLAVAFPLVWHHANREKGRSTWVVLPLFEYGTRDFGRRAHLFSLLGLYARNDDAKLWQLALFAPPSFHRRDALRDVDVVPPLFARWKVKDDGSSGFAAGPLVHSADARGATTAVVPIYWRFHDARTKATTQALFPIAGFHTRPGAWGGFLGPLYGWRSQNGAGGFGGGVAPLFGFGRSGTKRHAYVAPVFLHLGDAKDGRSTTVVGPGFWRRAPGGRGFDAGLFPILFFGKRDRGSYALVPPLFFHKGRDGESLDVFGPLYVRRGARGWGFGLAPLLFFGKREGRSHQIVFPLFFRTADEARRRSRMLVGPYYHGREGDLVTDVFFPLMYLKRAPGQGLLLSPVAGWRKTPQKETLVVGIYAYQRDARKQATTHLLFPLGAVHRAPGYEVTVQFPFFWRVKEGDQTDTTVFPFYWRSRSPRRAVDLVFPLVLRAKTEVATTTIVGPLYLRARRDGGRQAGLFPLFAYGKSVKDGKASSWFGAPLVYWDKSEALGTSRLWAGPFFFARRPSGYTSGFIPLAFAWRRDTASKVVTPIFYRQADSAAGYDLNVLGPFYWGKRPQDTRFGLLPLLFAKLRKDGTGSVLFLPFGFFEKKPLGGFTVATALFGWLRYPTGFRVYVGPLYARQDRETSSMALWPLVYFTRDKIDGSSTKMILPLYFDTRTKDDRQLAMYSPLLWRWRSVERSIIVGLPLFFDVHSFKESRTTGLLPFFIRNRSNVYKATSWVFPPILTWVRRHHDTKTSDVVIFPLVWRYAGAEKSTTVAFPLVWDFKRGGSRTTVFAPIGAYWKRPDARHWLVLNLYYRKGAGVREGSWWCDIFPLASFGRPRKGDLEWKLFEGLVGYARQGRSRTLTLFWLFDIPLKPVPASNLTWFGATPTSARTTMY